MRFDLTKLLALTLLGAGAAVAKRVPRGFVTTKGTKFQLDGKDFYYAGSNAYYFPFNDVGAAIAPVYGRVR